MAAISAVVFDIGNVLIRWDPRNLYRQMFDDPCEMEAFLGEAWTAEWAMKVDAGLPWDEAVRAIAGQHPEKVELIEAFDTRWHEMVDGEIETSVSLMANLKDKGLPVYGLTNFPHDKYVQTVPHHNFFRLFDGVVVSGVEKVAKPDPKIFEILIERFALHPEKTFYIDDNADNIAAGRRLGLVAHHYQSADALAEHVRELGLD